MSRRKQKKYEKELRAQRAAQEKIDAEDARKAEREEKARARKQAEEERRAALTPEERKKEDKRNTIIGLIGVGAVVLFLFAACGGGGDDDSDQANTADPTTTVQEEAAPPAVADAPVVISLPVTFAEEKNDIRVDAYDIGRHIVDGVDRERAVLDRAAWRIVAQCDTTVDGRLTVGVIKQEEHQIISNAGQGRLISENFFKSVLDCPAP